MACFAKLELLEKYAVIEFGKNVKFYGKVNMINLTINELVKYLGMPEKKIGDEYQWQCPICKDTGRDNLNFNEKKGLLQCFAL